MQKRFSLFQPGETAKELIQRFIEGFFTGNSPISVNIPELKAFKFASEPQERLLSISETYADRLNNERDGLPATKFPMILLTYPDFTQADLGIGSQVNKQDAYFQTDKNDRSFVYDDPLRESRVVLSYATEDNRNWQVRRYHYNLSVAIDILSTELETRQKLADLCRVMMDQYLVELSPFRDLSVPFMLNAYQYEVNDKKVSMDELGEVRYYPPFFPYGIIGIVFDKPWLVGTGDYDGEQIAGEENIYVSSFTIEGIRMEAFHLVEVPPFGIRTKLGEVTRVSPFGYNFDDLEPPAYAMRPVDC